MLSKVTKYLLYLLIVLSAAFGPILLSRFLKDPRTDIPKPAVDNAQTDSQAVEKLRFGLSGEVVGLDPAGVADDNSLTVINQVFDTLTAFRDKSTKLEPCLATSWNIDRDYKTYTFTLRRGVRFHDGSRFDADAAVFTFARMIPSPNVKWFGQGYQLPPIDRPALGFINQGLGQVIDSIEAAAEYTLVFKLKRVHAPFLADLALPWASIVSPRAALADSPAFHTNPVGTGPFQFIRWARGKEILLVRNEDYWNKSGQPYLDEILFRPVPNNSTRFMELKAGRIHVCQTARPENVITAQEAPDLKVAGQPGLNVGYLGFNFKKALWQNIHLRRAVALAIDRRAIVRKVYLGQGLLAEAPLSPEMWAYKDEPEAFPYDPEAAKGELAAAGYPLGENLPQIYLWAMPGPQPYNPKPIETGLAIIEYLKAVGIDAALTTPDWDVYLGGLRNAAPGLDLFLYGSTGDNGDPGGILSTFDGLASPGTVVKWENRDYHRLMSDGDGTFEPDARAGIFRRAIKMLHHDIVIVPLVHADLRWPISAKVMDLHLHPTGMVRLYPVRIHK